MNPAWQAVHASAASVFMANIGSLMAPSAHAHMRFVA